MRASVVEAETREEVTREMEERMQAMERMFMRRLASEVRVFAQSLRIQPLSSATHRVPLCAYRLKQVKQRPIARSTCSNARVLSKHDRSMIRKRKRALTRV